MSIVVVRRRSQCPKIFSKTTWPIKAKFYVEPPWLGGTKVCLWHLGHMTKMAAKPIYGKNPSKIFFSRTDWPIFTKLDILGRSVTAGLRINLVNRYKQDNLPFTNTYLVLHHHFPQFSNKTIIFFTRMQFVNT